MNNYNKQFKNMNYFSNILPENNINQQNNIVSPYEGFIRGNMFKNLYDPYKVNTPFEIRPLNQQAEMLTQINALGFALIDLNLYLDVYPNDNETINLFNKYRLQKKELLNNYENQYGPIELSSDALNTYPWSWDNKPWPWEN